MPIKKRGGRKPDQAAGLLGSGAARQAATAVQKRKANPRLSNVMKGMKKTRGK